MLSIFDQSQKESNHILNVNEDDFPEEFKEIIRKLQKAVVDHDIQNTMNLEDEVIQEIQNRERVIENLKDSLSEKEQALNEKDKALNENKKALSEKEQTISEKDEEIERLKRLLKQGNRF